jgi:hypothetical protein
VDFVHPLLFRRLGEAFRQELVLGFARTMTWNGKHLTTELVDAVYEKGVRLSVAEMNAVERNVDRDAGLGIWFLDIDGRTRKPG